jgi:hypothetical protein
MLLIELRKLSAELLRTGLVLVGRGLEAVGLATRLDQ